jgi:hypothetical protein
MKATSGLALAIPVPITLTVRGIGSLFPLD